MTQEREGLIELLEVYDWFGERTGVDCSGLTRKELLEEYERRIIRNR